MYLKKGEDLMPGDLFEDPTTESLETISLTTTFIPTETDIGEKITCMAKLSVEKMESQRQTMHILNVNCKCIKAGFWVFESLGYIVL